MNTGQDDPPLLIDDRQRDRPAIDLDVLRGWSETRDPALRRPHRLPALAELVELDSHDQPMTRTGLHGPDLLLGRFQSHYAPVDHGFRHLQDHQLYRLGAPHLRLFCDGQQWLIEVLSPQAQTRVNDTLVSHLHDDHRLHHGDLLTLGVTRFEFRLTDVSIDSWRRAQNQILNALDEPALFLKRRGGCCGPFKRLSQAEPLTLGRSFPPPGTMAAGAQWPEADAYRWDLSGLFDEERKYIAFRHARIALHKGQWTIEPLSTRQRTFVNRIGISGTIALQSGDEIGLGSVLLRFHHPHRTLESTGPRHQEVPRMPDWSEAPPPSATPSEKK